MDSLRWEHRPILRQPIVVAAFQGWNDAGDGASDAAAYLARRWGAETFAWIDPEDFFDFTSTRPEVRLIDGQRVIDWPETTFSSCPLATTGRDVVFLRGVEPQLHWKTYTHLVVEVMKVVEAELVVILGALLAEVPHTRPVRVMGTTGDRELGERLGFRQSRYEGPTGIVGVLHEALYDEGFQSASLWASVPAYVGQTPSPKAALALVEHLTGLMEVTVATADLDIAAAAYERQVDEVVAADEDATAYVRALEEATDDDGEETSGLEDLELPGGDYLAAEVERYLRDQGELSGAGAPDGIGLDGSGWTDRLGRIS